MKAAEPQALQRLRFLPETVELEAGHLAATDAAALDAGHGYVSLLLGTAAGLRREVLQRFGNR